MKSCSKPAFVTLSALTFLLFLAPSMRAQQPEATPSPAEQTATPQTAIAADIAVLQQQLAVLRLGETEQNPKVQATEARLAALTKALADQDTRAQEQTAASSAPFATAKLNREIADLQARQAELQKDPKSLESVKSREETPLIDDRIKALQELAQWYSAHEIAPENGLFQFGGGHPLDLIAAASERFHLPWLGIVTLPGAQSSIQVPAFTLFVQQPEDILKMYDWLAKSDPSLGEWEWQGNAVHPDVLMLSRGCISNL